MYKCKFCGIENERLVVHASHIRKFHKEKQVYKKVDFSKIESVENITLFELKKYISENIFINNRINPSFSNYNFIIKRDLIKYLSNIKYHTSFLNDSEKLKIRIYCILNDIQEYPKCLCGNIIEKFINNFNKFCTQSCANRFSNYQRESSFYKEVGRKIVKTRRLNNSYIPTDNFKNYLKDKNNYDKFKETCFIKYGVYNPGVLGAYSSKSAEKYIRNYIKDNNINEEMCYFKNGGVSGREYFLNIYNDNLHKYMYVSYDLVVIDVNKNIIEVLEYNGPWHYRKYQVDEEPFSNSTPYPKSKTKIETYNYDILKLNTIFEKCKNIKIYWEDDKKEERYNGSEL